MKQKRHSRKFDDVDLASLRLAFLKENSRYRKFIEENRDRILTAYRERRSAVLDGRAPKIPSVNRFGIEVSHEDAIRGFMAGGGIIPLDGGPVIKIPNPLPITGIHVWFHKRLEEDFGIVNPPFDVSMRSADGRRDVLNADESFDLLDPKKDIDILPKKRREAALRIMFSVYGIRQVVHLDKGVMFRRKAPYFWAQQDINNDDEDGEVSEEASISVFELEQRGKQLLRLDLLSDEDLKKRPSPWSKGELIPFPLSGLFPHERLLVVDLRKKKSELLAEFGAHLDHLTHPWKLDSKRDREQAWRHLKVWKMVTHQGMKFKEIATELNIRVYTAEFSFKQAHILTQGFPCPPGELAKLRNVVKSALQVTCDTCDKRETCTEECDEIQRYVGYGERRFTRERVVSQIVRLNMDDEDQNTLEDSLRTDPLQEWLQTETTDDGTD